MTILKSSILALAIAGLAGGTAHAQSAASREDASCIIALGFMQQQAPDQATKDRARGAMLYYLGRLDGREPALDLSKTLSEAAKAFTPAEGRAVLAKCGGLATERGQALEKAAGSVRSALQAR